jgi:hypothetical protein
MAFDGGVDFFLAILTTIREPVEFPFPAPRIGSQRIIRHGF